MAMDINDFGLQQECFGYNKRNKRKRPTDYAQMSRSNTEFLNLTGKQKRELDAIKKDYFARIDALPPTADAERNALFAELEQKLKEKGAEPQDLADAQNAEKKAKRGEKINQGLQTALDIFTKTTDALGISKKVGNEGQGKDGNTPPPPPSGDKKVQVPMWAWIVGGVAVVGLGVFAIYKFRK